MHLLVMSDTHVPKRARDLPDQLWRAVDEAHGGVHARGRVDVALLDRLEQPGKRPLGGWGNNEGPGLRARLPEVAYGEVGGVRLAVVHETGGRAGRERRAAARFPDTDVVVFGHSHIPWDPRAESGLRLLNPGSPTDRRRQP